METLCLRNAPKRYIVSIGNKILLVTHDHRYAKQVEAEIRIRKITDESYTVISGGTK
jgi:hypothetical protein